MIKKIIGIIICISLIFTMTACAEKKVTSKNVMSESMKKLNEAEKILIKEKLISAGKQYDIYVDDEKVAKVMGKMVKLNGDVFTMEDVEKNFIIKEEQTKRWGVKYNRNAVIKDEEDNVLGYIGEKTFSKIFSSGYTFHFFNKDKEVIGTSDEVTFSLFKKNKYYNTKKEIAYEVNKKIGVTDKYELIVKDKKDIPLYNAILMVCIEDSIVDAHKDKKK